MLAAAPEVPPVSPSELASQFCFELAFGVYAALAFVPRAPVGVLFYRLLGTSAALGALAGAVLLPALEERPWHDPIVWCGALAVLAWPVVSGPFRGKRWAAALALSLLACALAVARLVVAGAPGLSPPPSPPLSPPLSPGGLALASASALASGAVVGSVAVAMVLGHWYLTIPKLDVAHLRRLNRVSAGCMGLALVLVGLVCAAFDDRLAGAEPSLFGPTGLFYLGTRLGVGLFVPLLFAAMAASSLRFRNTRSATGILYASTVLVLIGAAVSVSLQGAYGVPL